MRDKKILNLLGVLFFIFAVCTLIFFNNGIMGFVFSICLAINTGAILGFLSITKKKSKS